MPPSINLQYNAPRKQSGFSLIEVLIASLILFLSITLAFNIYRTAIISTDTAQQTLRLQAHIVDIQKLITQQIRRNGFPETMRGEGDFNDLIYSWQATPIARGRAEHPDNEPLGAGFSLFNRGGTVMLLWQVEMAVEYQGKVRQFNFTELTW